MVEFTNQPLGDEGDKPEGSIWVIYMNGSTNGRRRGTGLVLTSLEGLEMEYAIRLSFKATNNKVKYEAVVASLGIARVQSSDNSKQFSSSR